eukprot:857879-Prorocentrum_minimum.AAC.1
MRSEADRSCGPGARVQPARQVQQPHGGGRGARAADSADGGPRLRPPRPRLRRPRPPHYRPGPRGKRPTTLNVLCRSLADYCHENVPARPASDWSNETLR